MIGLFPPIGTEQFRRAVMAVPRAKDLADWKRIEKETA